MKSEVPPQIYHNTDPNSGLHAGLSTSVSVRDGVYSSRVFFYGLELFFNLKCLTYLV